MNLPQNLMLNIPITYLKQHVFKSTKTCLSKTDTDFKLNLEKDPAV